MRKLAVLGACLLFAIPCQARIIYVDANTPDNNDGSSWADAYKYLQDALADADSSGDVNEIWVAQGTQPYDTTNGIYFCDYMTPANESWITAASEIDQDTHANGISYYVFNTHEFDRFWIVASDLVTTTVYVDRKIH